MVDILDEIAEQYPEYVKTHEQLLPLARYIAEVNDLKFKCRHEIYPDGGKSVLVQDYERLGPTIRFTFNPLDDANIDYLREYKLIIEYTKMISDNPTIFDREYDIDVLKIAITEPFDLILPDDFLTKLPSELLERDKMLWLSDLEHLINLKQIDLSYFKRVKYTALKYGIIQDYVAYLRMFYPDIKYHLHDLSGTFEHYWIEA